MHLSHLSLTNFRNYSRLDIDFPCGPILLLGGNAQGKTSILESIFYLATFESFHATSDRQLINFIAARESLAVARIVADFMIKGNRSGSSNEIAHPHRIEARIISEGGEINGSSRMRKEILVDGVKRKVGEAVGRFNAVLFLPQMLRIVEGAPEERRHFLNLVLAQVWPHYREALGEYQRSLAQRNALLKQLSERGTEATNSTMQLAYWDEQLSNFGAQVIHGRIHAIHELEQLAVRIHTDLTRGQEVLRLAYQPSYDPFPRKTNQFLLPMDVSVDRTSLSVEKIREGFMACLEKARPEEIARGTTTIGPHRDDFRFISNKIDVGVYGSRGQARTAVLSAKLAEVAWIRKKTGNWPVLLLDEVLAELDRERRDDLLERLSEAEQVLTTTTELDAYNHEFARNAAIWFVREGRLSSIEGGAPKDGI